MSARARFTVRRLLLTLPVLAVMSVVVFLVIRLVPGDPATSMLGTSATPQLVAQVREDLQFDRPLPAQYADWIGGVVQGDLGKDYLSNQPVTEQLRTAVPVTLELAVGSLLVGLLLGVPFAMVAVARAGWPRRLTEGFVVAGMSIADFWLGIMLVLLFATALTLLPPSGYVSLTDDPIGNLRYYVLPMLTLGIGQAAIFARTTRAAVEDAMKAPSILLLRGKGLTERSILWRHALRNAGPPLVTVVGIQAGVLLGGAIVVETLFDLPGLGALLVSSIGERNYLVVQGCVLVIATVFIFTNLITDLIVGWLDPRIADGAAQ